MTTATATLAAPLGTRHHHYPAVTQSVPAMARAWAAKQLAELGVPGDLAYTALAVISELITNVYYHAPGEADLTLGLQDGHLVVTCADGGSSELPQLFTAAPDDEHGRGLAIVRAVALNMLVRRRLVPGKRIIVCLGEGEAP